MEFDNKSLWYIKDALDLQLQIMIETIQQEDLSQDDEADIINDMMFVEGLLRVIDDELKIPVKK